MAATDGAPVDVTAIQPENSREVNPLFCPASPENRVCRFGPSIVISKYGGEVQLPAIMELMRRDLSEPYSVFTYRYFVEGWPELCFVAHTPDGNLAGAIVGKAEPRSADRANPFGDVRTRGYVAMLAVEQSNRRTGLGAALVTVLLNTMAKICHEVVLETEATNAAALRLYEKLGFVRDKRLPKYYLNGNDAFRLWYKLKP